MAESPEELAALGTALVREAERRGSVLRLLGGVACYLNSPRGRDLPNLRRAYKDLDFAAIRKGSRVLPAVFADLGWQADAQFNALHGATRLVFVYEDHLQADIFLGEFAQCHRIVFNRGLADHGLTLPLGDLLLTKLQIHQLNAKDVQDVLGVLYDHDYGLEDPSERPALDAILRLLSRDWGWYATVLDNLVAIQAAASDLLSGDEERTVIRRLQWLRDQIGTAPKSARWTLRSHVGRRWRWYEEPEEVHR